MTITGDLINKQPPKGMTSNQSTSMRHDLGAGELAHGMVRERNKRCCIRHRRLNDRPEDEAMQYDII